MCLTPLTLPTRSKYINLNQIGTALLQTFPCGKCSECRKAKSSEYAIRANEEHKHTLELGGFTYWETLTYSPFNVPVYSVSHGLQRGEDKKTSDSILTFNPVDYRNFFKRLRINLKRAGYESKGNLKYFFTCEYGGKTFRPHYHCLFFVTIPHLTPQEFEKHIFNSWNMGRIDFSKTASGKVINGDGALHYVAKYVNKDADYMSVLDNYCSRFDVPSFDKKHILQPFHRQSQGFGLSLLGNQDYKLMFEESKIKFSDSQGIHTASLSTYFKRKLFYELRTLSDGTLKWFLTDEGKKWMFNFQLRKVDDYVNKFVELYNNASSILPEQPGITSLIDHYLGKRSLTDLAYYNVFFRNRLITSNITELSITDICPYLSANYELDLSTDKSRSTLVFNEFTRCFDSASDDSCYSIRRCDLHQGLQAIDERSCIQFRYFDRLNGLFDLLNLCLDKSIDSNWNYYQEVASRLKLINSLYA